MNICLFIFISFGTVLEAALAVSFLFHDQTRAFSHVTHDATVVGPKFVKWPKWSQMESKIDV